MTKLAVEWGQAADPADVRAALAAEPAPGYQAVLLTHNETSTGVMNPIPALAAAIRDVGARRAASSSTASRRLGAVPFEMDAWGIDVVVTGSQKAWMAAPGTGHGRRLRARLGGDGDGDDAALLPRPPTPIATSHAKGQTPWTPALAVVYQVDEGLELMEREGAAAVFARHAACAAAARAGLRRLGFELFADQRFASRTVTAAQRPRRARLEGVQRRAQARAASSWPVARAS